MTEPRIMIEIADGELVTHDTDQIIDYDHIKDFLGGVFTTVEIPAAHPDLRVIGYAQAGAPPSLAENVSGPGEGIIRGPLLIVALDADGEVRSMLFDECRAYSLRHPEELDVPELQVESIALDD